jgi:hypothetical protein
MEKTEKKTEIDDSFKNKEFEELFYKFGAQNFYNKFHSFTNKLSQEKSNFDMEITLKGINSELIFERENKINNISDSFELIPQQLDILLALETFISNSASNISENTQISITEIQKFVIELIDRQLLKNFEL